MTKDPKLSRSSLGNRLLPLSYTYTKQLTTCSSIGERVPSPIASRWCERDSTIWEREQELDARARVRRAACCLLRKRQGFRNHDEKLTVPPSTTVPNDQTADDSFKLPDSNDRSKFTISRRRFLGSDQTASDVPNDQTADDRFQLYSQPTTVPTLQYSSVPNDPTADDSSEFPNSNRQF
jgi:hypothetical protein